MSSSHEQFPESPLPTAGINPNDAAHLEGIPYDVEPLELHYNEDHTVDTGQLQQVQTGEYWSPRPPAQELPGVTTETQPAKKERFSLKAKFAAAAAGVALLAAAGIGVKAANDNANQPPHPEQTTSGSATPGAQETTPVATPNATPSQAETSPKTNLLEISANLTDEQAAKKVVEIFSGWGMAGATKEVYDNQLSGDNATLTLEQYADKIAQQQAELYRPLFPESYKSDPALVQFFDGSVKSNRQNILNYLTTAGGASLNPRNIEPWKYSEKYDGLVSAHTEDASRTLVINSTETNNGSKNIYGSSEYSNFPTQLTITLTENNGHEKITAAHFAKR
jgi:hypothetical protein